MFDVYRHTSPSGKSYVGWTSKGTSVRWRTHCVNAAIGKQGAFYAAIRKYGPDAFTHEVLERMITEAGAKRAEQIWIRELRTKTPTGYNICSGGEGFTGNHTPETRAKMSRAKQGKKRSAETVAKMKSRALAVPPEVRTARSRKAALFQWANVPPEVRSARARKAALARWGNHV